MQNKTAVPVHSKRMSHTTVLEKIFSIIMNLILLAMLSWVLLTLYFCFKMLIAIDHDVINQIKLILDGNINFIDSNKFLYRILNFFQYIQNACEMFLRYVLDFNLSKNLSSILIGVIEIIIVRAIIFVMSLPIFILIYFLLIVDGLVARDIRKFKAAKESTFFFSPNSVFIETLIFYHFLYLHGNTTFGVTAKPAATYGFATSVVNDVIY